MPSLVHAEGGKEEPLAENDDDAEMMMMISIDVDVRKCTGPCCPGLDHDERVRPKQRRRSDFWGEGREWRREVVSQL